MATWLVHLRIADFFIEHIDWLNASEFAVGSVAPDCGYGEKDSFGEFTPPPTVTHWTPTGRKLDCRYRDFFKTYLQDQERNAAYSFYLGYYIHLLTDIMWSATIYMPTHTVYQKEYAKNPEFLKVIKEDWYDLDHKFLRDHPRFRAFELLEKKDSVRDYLPYYEKNQLTTQIRSIVNFYNENRGKTTLDRVYPYLSEQTMNQFIACANELIQKQLIHVGVL